MVDILDTRLWTSPDWGDHPPMFNTETVDGVEVTGLVVDGGDLFTGSEYDETGAWRHGYDEGSVHFDIVDTGSAIRIEMWPFLSESTYHRFDVSVFDGNGSLLAHYMSDTCHGYDSGCEVWLGFNYDFSGETKHIESASWNEFGGDASFDTDRLLVAHGISSAPDTWPHALEVDGDYNVEVIDGLAGEYCPGSTNTISIEIENTKFVGSLTGILDIEDVYGDIHSVDVDIPEAESEIFDIEIEIPDIDDSLRSETYFDIYDVSGDFAVGADESFSFDVEVINTGYISGEAEVFFGDDSGTITVDSGDTSVINLRPSGPPPRSVWNVEIGTQDEVYTELLERYEN